MAPRVLGEKEIQLRAFKAARVSGRPAPKAPMKQALRSLRSSGFQEVKPALKAKPKRKQRRRS